MPNNRVDLKFAISISLTKKSSSLSSHNTHLRKQHILPFQVSLIPGADLVIILPPANNNNSTLSHSAHYNALILSVDS